MSIIKRPRGADSCLPLGIVYLSPVHYTTKEENLPDKEGAIIYFQKDYVLRMIEMIGETARRITALLHDRKAYDEIDEIAKRACGLPLSMLRTGDMDMLIFTLEEPPRFLAAQLLQIAARVDARTQSDDELLPTLTQALQLYASLREPDYLLPACDAAAQIMSAHLTSLADDALVSAAALFEAGGAFSSAEDAWYELASRQDSHKAGFLAFYDRIEALDDAALLAGNLPRQEIAEGRSGLN